MDNMCVTSCSSTFFRVKNETRTWQRRSPIITQLKCMHESIWSTFKTSAGFFTTNHFSSPWSVYSMLMKMFREVRCQLNQLLYHFPSICSFRLWLPWWHNPLQHVEKLNHHTRWLQLQSAECVLKSGTDPRTGPEKRTQYKQLKQCKYIVYLL